MIPGSDTARQDLILVGTGFIALLLFFWLYYDFHPLPAADNSLGESTVSDRSVEFARQLGFESMRDPVIGFQINTSLLDSLQKETDFKNFYSNPLHKSLNPAFYWNSRILVGREEVENVQTVFNVQTAKIIELQLSEGGELISLRNRDNNLPSRIVNREAMSYAFNIENLSIQTLPTDSLVLHSFRFSLSDMSDTEIDSAKISRGEPINIGRDAAERLAEYYIRMSGWPENRFKLDRIDLQPFESFEVVRATFKNQEMESVKPVSVTLDILPTGDLVSMQYSFELSAEPAGGIGSIIGGVRGIILLLAFFCLIIMLFIRFRLRLVDMKIAILVAVLGGFLFPSLFIVQELYTHLNSFEKFEFYFIVGLLIGMGFLAAISSIGLFVVTAISDSITRQNWPEKLRTFDLLRIGHYVNIPIGLSIVRGISWGFILSLIFVVVITLLPDSYVTLTDQFTANKIYLPFIFSLVGNFLIAFLIVAVIFLVIIGKIWASFKSGWMIIAVTGLIMLIVNPLAFNIGGLGTEISISAVSGVILGWIYLKEDFMTILLSVFVYISLITTANGWLLSGSPDAFEFYAFILILIAGFIYGAANIYSGRSANELPDFVPDYIQELASENRIKQELQIARKVQQSFLPSHTPKIDGLDIYAICKPAFETGGDYYDFIDMPDNQLAITIGDVSGKGIEAAFYMTFIKGVLYAFCDEYTSAKDVLTKMNKLFRKNADRGTFISLIFGMFNSEKNIFQFSRAGHNPLLYYSFEEKKLHTYQPEGIAVGMADEHIFRKHISEQSIHLNKGDLLILYTDGIVEAVNRENELFGENRLNHLIQKHHHLNSMEIVEKIEQKLSEFVDQADQYDDLTMIVIKKN